MWSLVGLSPGPNTKLENAGLTCVHDMEKPNPGGHCQRTDSLEKTLTLGKIEGGRRRGQQRMRWLEGITDPMGTWVWVNSGSWWWTRRPGVLQSMVSQGVWETELNWTDMIQGTFTENQLKLDIFLSFKNINLYKSLYELWISYSSKYIKVKYHTRASIFFGW